MRFECKLSAGGPEIRYVERESRSGCGTVRKIWVPEGWSQTATDILAQKYARRAGVPSETESVEEDGIPSVIQRHVPTRLGAENLGGEIHARMIFRRLAGAWTYHGWKGGYFDGEVDAHAFYNEVFFMLERQMAAPASPQWFNTGLWWAYGLEGENSGLWEFHYESNGTTTYPAFKSYVKPMVHACFLQSVSDDLVGADNSIMELWKSEARVFKFGGGSGSNFSDLRAENEPLSGGGYASGVMSWLRIGDVVGGSIKSGGTTRRAAKMVELDCDHPDILDFVRWKRVEEQKVAALIAGSSICADFVNALWDVRNHPERWDAIADAARAGGVPDKVVAHGLESVGRRVPWDFPRLDADFQGEAYRTVSGQNSNNTVRLTDAFMHAADSGGPWPLYWRTELVKAEREGRKPSPSQVIQAKDLWGEIVNAAWHCADPGVQFDTTINEWNTCAEDGAIRTSNPCVTGDTLILTGDGPRAIESLVGKEVEVWNGERWSLVTPRNTGCNQPTVRVTLEDGRSVRCTLSHRFPWDINYGDPDTEEMLEAKFLKAGDTIIDYPMPDSGRPKGLVKIKAVEWAGVAAEVYCFKDPLDGRGTFGGIVTGQCAEFLFLDDNGCNLASLNVVKFQREDGTLDCDGWSHACRVWTAVLDITVGMAGYPTERIARGSGNYRTLGLGYANLGAAVMRRGLPYDSDDARAWAAGVTALMHFTAGAVSAEMAEEMGKFPRFDANREHMLRVVRNHAAAARKGMDFVGCKAVRHMGRDCGGDGELRAAVSVARDACFNAGVAHGYRNAQWTLCAPTGTIGLLMDCDTTGVEPDFALVKFKKLVGGGHFRLANASLGPALVRLGYAESQAADVVDYAVGRTDEEALLDAPHGFARNLKVAGVDAVKFLVGCEKAVDVRSVLGEAVKGFAYAESQWADINDHLCGRMTVEGAPHLREEHLAAFDCANRCGRKGTRSISINGHLEMMAAVQPFLSGAISKTINAPADATPEDISHAYKRGWELGLKAIAVYRDGSKMSQPLESGIAAKKAESPKAEAPKEIPATQTLARGQRRKLPARRGGETVKCRIAGHGVYVRTGEYEDGSLGEIFIDLSKEGASLRSWAGCLAKAVSIGLQYGVPVQAFVDSLCGVRFEPSGVVTGHESIRTASSVVDLIFRELLAREQRSRPASWPTPPANGTPLTEEARTHRIEGPVGLSAFAVINRGIIGALATARERLGDLPKTLMPLAPATVSTAGGSVAEARLKGYEGEPCGGCGMYTLVRCGACLRCDSCHATSGCG